MGTFYCHKSKSSKQAEFIELRLHVQVAALLVQLLRILRRIPDARRDGEDEEDDSTDDGDCSDGDFRCNQATADDCEASANGMTQDASDDDSPEVLTRSEHDRGDL